MKKKVLALLFGMLMCIFSLTACIETEETVTDSTIVDNLTQGAQQLLEQIVAMEDDELTHFIEYYGVDGMSPNAGLLSGLESWEANREDLGAYVSFGLCKVIYNSDNRTYTAVAEASFEKRSCEFRMIVNRQMSEISSMTFNPNFTFGEKMGRAGMNTLMGIGTVFVMLLIISVIIYCFKYIHAWEENRAKAKTTEQAAPVLPVTGDTAEEEVPETEELTDDLELVAVITAAIAASEGTSADGLVVRSIRRAGTSNWKRA